MTSSKNERIHGLYEHSAKYNEVYIKKTNPTEFYVVERPTAVTATERESRPEFSEFVQGREGVLLDDHELDMCERAPWCFASEHREYT